MKHSSGYVVVNICIMAYIPYVDSLLPVCVCARARALTHLVENNYE